MNKRYQVRNGTEFSIDSVELVNANAKAESNRTKHFISKCVIFVVISALFISTIISLIDGTFDEINAVWNAAAFPLGYVLAEYFRKPP